MLVLSQFPILSTYPPGYAWFDPSGLSTAHLLPIQWQSAVRMTYCQNCGSSKCSYSSTDSALVTFFALNETNVKIFAIDHKKTSKQRRKIIGCFGRILRFDDALFLEFYNNLQCLPKGYIRTEGVGQALCLCKWTLYCCHSDVIILRVRYMYRYLSGSENRKFVRAC